MPATHSHIIISVALPVPLRQCFDYYAPDNCENDQLQVGLRILVPFGRKRLVGIIHALGTDASVATDKLRKALRVIDKDPLFTNEIMELCQWASRYYHHPIGEVYAAALPVLFRGERDASVKKPCRWLITECGRTAAPAARAMRQIAMLERLRQSESGLNAEQMKDCGDGYRATLKTLEDKGWVSKQTIDESLPLVSSDKEQAHDLNEEQQRAVHTIKKGLHEFSVFLLHGVTGSGKTEVYLQVLEKVLQDDGQVLILVPEIGLTPQLLQRFSRRFGALLAVFHSGLSDGERARNWILARSGQARIIIGTRSAVFACLHKPKLIIIDEEHDLSLKQQDGFRYYARDLAIVRARHAGIPIILGSATPSLESLQNAREQRYTLLNLRQRAGSAIPPKMHLIDLRHQKMDEGLSPVLIDHIGRHLQQQGQVLLFLNRRGFAPTLLCHDCGWVGHCRRCDANLTFHHGSARLRCHHCGSDQPVPSFCPDCGSGDLRPIGQGTERTEQALQRHFPDQRVSRIDRDTTRRKGEMEKRLADAESGRDQILLGTQLLAKGHHFPNVTLVAILDCDQGLFSADFRGAERMAQLILQVAGRAGRADKPGEVMVQTHHPDHALLQTIISSDYAELTDSLLQERGLVQWPPFSHLALIRAEATKQALPMQFLTDAADLIRSQLGGGLMLLGPVPSPMEKRAGRFRAQLLVHASQRSILHQMLNNWLAQIETLKSARQVRWSLDIDPQEMF